MAKQEEFSAVNEWQYFEALDRAHMVQHHLESALKTHPAILRHPELKMLYEQAEKALDELYSSIGQFSF